MELNLLKTQAIEFYDAIIDTPGEFLQHRKYYNALNVTATEADGLVYWWRPPIRCRPFLRLFFLFNKEVIGIVTKIDMAEQPEQIEKQRQLKAAGAKEIFEISATENEGIDRLQAYLSQTRDEKPEYGILDSNKETRKVSIL